MSSDQVRFPWASPPDGIKTKDAIKLSNAAFYPLGLVTEIILNNEFFLSGKIEGNKESDKLEHLFTHLFCLDSWNNPEFGDPLFVFRNEDNSYFLYCWQYTSAVKQGGYIEVVELEPETFRPIRIVDEYLLSDQLWDRNLHCVEIPIEMKVVNGEGAQLHHFTYPHSLPIRSSDTCVARREFILEKAQNVLRYSRPKISIDSNSKNIPNEWSDTDIAMFYMDRNFEGIYATLDDGCDCQ